MIALVLLLLLAPSKRVELVDEDYKIAAGDYHGIGVELRQQPATVIASYLAEGDANQVRIALVPRGDAEPFKESAILAATPRGKSGGFAYRVRDPDNYAIIVDNRADKSTPATVRLRVLLDFSGPRVTQLPPGRQFTVIAISFLAFFAVVTYSARRLLKAARG